MFRFFTRFPFPIRAGDPHTHLPPSINSQKTTKPAFRRPYRSPCLAASRTPRIPIRTISPYRHSLTMLPPRPARRLTQTRRQPVSTNSLRRRRTARRRRQRMASPRDAASTGAPRSGRPEGRRLRPKAWIPEESGQAGPGKSPQMRRQGNRIRRTNDRPRRPSARPGVTLAPGFAVSTSLLYHVFLEVSR